MKAGVLEYTQGTIGTDAWKESTKGITILAYNPVLIEDVAAEKQSTVATVRLIGQGALKSAKRHISVDLDDFQR